MTKRTFPIILTNATQYILELMMFGVEFSVKPILNDGDRFESIIRVDITTPVDLPKFLFPLDEWVVDGNT